MVSIKETVNCSPITREKCATCDSIQICLDKSETRNTEQTTEISKLNKERDKMKKQVLKLKKTVKYLESTVRPIIMPDPDIEVLKREVYEFVRGDKVIEEELIRLRKEREMMVVAGYTINDWLLTQVDDKIRDLSKIQT